MTTTMSRSRALFLAAMVAAGATAAACTTPAAAAAEFTTPMMTWPSHTELTDRDELFLTALDNQGIDYLTPQTAVTAAIAVCLLRADGAELAAARTAAGVAGWTPTGAGFFTGAATAAYCPDIQAGGA